MDINIIKKRLKAYTPVDISIDLTSLSRNQKLIVKNLIDAGKLADDIFWRQSSHDALNIRNQYRDQPGPIRDYIEINYGPYDRLHDHKRFVGNGPDLKPLGAGFYPEDITREDFLEFVKQHPDLKNKFESLYSVITQKSGSLTAEYYHQIYQYETQQIAQRLERAAELSINQSLKSYLESRANAVKNDDYYKSDIAWMNLTDSLIDIVIGPIENYEDRLFNYKTAYEAAVMIKDISATEELDVYKQHLNNLEQNLPVDNRYKKATTGSGNILEIVNIVYFGGDYQAGVKTIASSLPNDEKVISEKGAKKQLYKNIMEAKFDQILTPIAHLLIGNRHKSLLSKKRFISQVLLHEISHTIGPNYVFGKNETVRKSLKEKYSIIEECKADILGIYAVPYFAEIFAYNDSDIAEHYITFVAGLFRSIRFGIEEAHGLANLIQLNYLRKKNVIGFDDSNGNYTIDLESFHLAVLHLAEILLKIEAHGDYEEAQKLVDRFGQMTDETKESIEKLNEIPTDLDINFSPIL
jgi:hypothetical protein